MEVSIYTDGSARGNPDGPGGYGTILVYVDSQGIKHYGYAINIKSFSYIEKKEKQAEQANEPNPEEKADFKNQDTQSGEIIKF